jgi:hypothetical protein
MKKEANTEQQRPEMFNEQAMMEFERRCVEGRRSFSGSVSIRRNPFRFNTLYGDTLMRTRVFLAVALLASVAAGNALAQASGNFSAAGTGAACAIGVGGGFNGSGTAVTFFDADISTSSGSGVTLDIRPSLVTGLFTDTKISTTVPTSSADIGIQVCVTVDNSAAGILPTNCAVYNQRFQSISSQLFSQLSECTLANLGTACTTSGDCPDPVNDICLLGTCFGPNPLCNFDLILSTLSANSFDFVVPVSNGKPHHVKATWSVIGNPANNTAGSNTASCVGPGILTVTQYKVFNNSGSLSF